ncbi:MAG: 4-(cytidine 5'-diphospho)-2-C-methyl-D-erythritol kinase [Pseudomonadota bacterium]|nr:4-(cytidine 5'-diphospho)-2-C-methyl-D-erythritol kinase [Pseudomonadota bacterium]
MTDNLFQNPVRVVSVGAPAKINLYLNITGQRVNNYHELDSLIAFAAHGDQIEVKKCDHFNLEASGPFSEKLPPSNENLVMKAAKELARGTNYEGGACIKLIKNLPVSSGIGGGSADAAATLKALNDLWETNLQNKDLMVMALRLGADVPVCLLSKTVRMSGIGDKLSRVSGLPKCGILLINPGIPISTVNVFQLCRGDFSNQVKIPNIENREVFFEFLSTQKNDLQDAAIKIAPIIKEVLKILTDDPNCRLARLSGSGGTCFGLYEDEPKALFAAEAMYGHFSDWWIQPTRLTD